MIERINGNLVSGLLMTFLVMGLFVISAESISAQISANSVSGENCMTAYEVQRENNDSRFTQRQKDEDTEKAKQCWLQKVEDGEKKLRGAYLPGANFQSKNLMGVDFEEANLTGADFDHAYLHGANLREANLSGANLFRARLNSTETRVRGVMKKIDAANLKGAKLNNAKLGGADFRGVNLESANLIGAIGIGDGANFNNAIVSRSTTKGLSYTEWRDLGVKFVD